MYAIDVPMYEIQVFVTTKVKELERLGAILGMEFRNPSIGGGTTYNVDGEFILIYLGRPCAGVIAHECLHATNMIMDVVGIEADLDNDEAQAYLLGYLVETIHQSAKPRLRKDYPWKVVGEVDFKKLEENVHAGA